MDKFERLGSCTYQEFVEHLPPCAGEYCHRKGRYRLLDEFYCRTHAGSVAMDMLEAGDLIFAEDANVSTTAASTKLPDEDQVHSGGGRPDEGHDVGDEVI